jgi:hypothetical protein
VNIAPQLAIDGGAPVRKTALSPWPWYDDDEVEVAAQVLRSGRVNYWTGNECREFEKEFASYHGLEYGVALANGTLALELAFKVLGVGDGDEVIVTPRSYVASASSIVLCGATPVFVDIDPDSQNLRVDLIRAAVTEKTRAILAVHLAGWPCDMLEIMQIAKENDLFVVEDCAQAHGARIGNKLVGSFGDVSAFSFCQDKIMTTAGEGGMLLTNDSELWAKAWAYKDHGKSWALVQANDHPPGFRWVHSSFGSNWRMTEIQGAIGRVQLRKLEHWLLKRRKNVERLVNGLSDISALRIALPPADVCHAYYMFYAFLRPEMLKPGWTRDRILLALTAEGIPGKSGSCPEIYRESAFSDFNFPSLPVARMMGELSVSLPVHPTLKGAEVDDIVIAVHKVFAAARSG